MLLVFNNNNIISKGDLIDNSFNYKEVLEFFNNLKLYNRNFYPLEYYQQGMEPSRDNAYISVNYSNKSTLLLDIIEGKQIE